MIDLHPACSGLPLASTLFLVAAELSGVFPRLRASRNPVRVAAVSFVLISVACAFFSGYQATDRAGELTEVVESAMANHHSLGRLLLINSFLVAAFFFIARVAVRGIKLLWALYYLALTIQIVLTAWVGYLGGALVFTHGINVKTSAVAIQD